MLIIDQLSKARQIMALLIPQLKSDAMDDEKVYRLLALSALEDFETVCLRVNNYVKGNGSLPQNPYSWMRDNIHHIKRSRLMDKGLFRPSNKETL
jgi:hypothetical protein